ncbi:membrane anchor opy2 protein [Pyrenophora tritici-repentis]|uniref:Membrane anchor opy2 n=2 Tax=Pyrenophora tritici-repentis TaxID=45151 RepID=A0A2W1EZ22_9PLEO|nr:uncharacterized protein PTRG_01358 [Pyrenophora tritici-repentis Pt-1C-BFP]KAA8626009.1 membrane anchor opy2 [Pyrenophora tritici-repentis]EDU40796.1 conserved hypothetical protein [Pyrenophora tritici-repentis Pt-1C-BFP]KAF7454422.1 membrane anchor opy2 [Pyrenophora tritici-repentis]KAF7577542.1 putative membrane anchor opy2 protein [Pyrenophora tritici-repentis]KAG9388168.1 membrane anchor opy2 [Pyrenophora tritici-repentis]
MSIRALRDAESVFRLDKRCKLCEQAPLSCEGITCPANQVCVQSSRTCDECASVACQIDPIASSPAPANKTNVGAIAGGVIGGVAFIAILTFVVWKFCLKGKRRSVSDEGEWQSVDLAQQEKEDNDFQSRRSARASTHTVASMASSVLTRASNIIQIAYIPGVTNRSGPGSPDLLVPPVPPIPSMSPSSGMTSPYSNADQHFFVPDFRDSIMSASTVGRTSIAPSLAQRGSVASTMYRQNAIVSPLPAQTIVRGKAAVVSVKSTATNSPAETPKEFDTPPVPQIDPKHGGLKPIRIQMPGVSPANSVRSTAQLGGVKALNITKKRSMDITPPKSSSNSLASDDRTLVNSPEVLVPSARPLTGYSTTSSDDGVAHSRARRGSLASESGEESDDDHARAKQTLFRNSSTSSRDSGVTEIQDKTPTMDRSPFTDSSSLEPPRPMMSQRITSYDTSRTPMTPIVEEAASKRGSTVSRRDQSPFHDSNKSEL